MRTTSPNRSRATSLTRQNQQTDPGAVNAAQVVRENGRAAEIRKVWQSDPTAVGPAASPHSVTHEAPHVSAVQIINPGERSVVLRYECDVEKARLAADTTVKSTV